MTFTDYMIIRNFDLNKRNINQDIINSQGSKLGEIIIFQKMNQLNYNNNQKKLDESINTKNQKESTNENNIIFNNISNRNNIKKTNSNIIQEKSKIPKDHVNCDLINNNIIVEGTQEEKPKHYLGLDNIGATCYMNATLQCLCHILSFKNYFENPERIKKDSQNRNPQLTNCFSELIKNICNKSNNKSYAPNNFKNLISELNPLFRGIQANDSKDLILFIYETLHSELNNPKSDEIKIDYLNNSNIPEDLKLFRDYYYSQNKSIISQLFYSEQSSSLKCCSCNFDKISYNIINFLIFPLEKIRLLLSKKKPGGFYELSLEECFELNEEPDTLDGFNQIYCNNCKKQSNALSSNKLYNCPEVLTIILNRGKGLEFNVEFKFPFHLNIEKYIVDKSCGSTYELIGVIAHLGPSGMSGHFIAYCKSPYDRNWYCYNDSIVSHCINIKEEVKLKSIPYVLFYQKIKNYVQTKNITEETPKDNNKNKDGNKNFKLVLYFTYEEKEAYLDLTENKLFSEVKKELCSKFKFIPYDANNYYIMRGETMIYIDDNKGVIENEIKNGDKICIVK
jgi:ubiquitin carboxyl-terminal hydrolase 2/21